MDSLVAAAKVTRSVKPIDDQLFQARLKAHELAHAFLKQLVTVALAVVVLSVTRQLSNDRRIGVESLPE